MRDGASGLPGGSTVRTAARGKMEDRKLLRFILMCRNLLQLKSNIQVEDNFDIDSLNV